ncbi:MAG: helix-turn-helix domain-containing protein [Atopobiaceae bacterium]|nr:helix-turn-helix domain-containing protein [Atopobiaceae bacterium]
MLLNKEKEFYTIKELINAGFGSRSTIYRHIKEDGLPAIKIGYRVLIPREPFEEFVNAHRVKHENA